MGGRIFTWIVIPGLPIYRVSPDLRSGAFEKVLKRAEMPAGPPRENIFKKFKIKLVKPNPRS